MNGLGTWGADPSDDARRETALASSRSSRRLRRPRLCCGDGAPLGKILLGATLFLSKFGWSCSGPLEGSSSSGPFFLLRPLRTTVQILPFLYLGAH